MTPARFDTAAARQHVTALADVLGVTVSWCPSVSGAESYPASRAATLPRIRGPRGYLVALHEIGHCISPAARRLYNRFDFPGEFACEAWAWSWAIEQVLPCLAEQMTDRDWATVGRCLGTYAASEGYRIGHPESDEPALP